MLLIMKWCYNKKISRFMGKENWITVNHTSLKSKNSLKFRIFPLVFGYKYSNASTRLITFLIVPYFWNKSQFLRVRPENFVR